MFIIMMVLCALMATALLVQFKSYGNSPKESLDSDRSLSQEPADILQTLCIAEVRE